MTVNGQTAYRKGEYFRKELSVNNSAAPAWEQVTVSATGEPTITGYRFVPKTPEQFGYDADGNMTSDGRWSFSWDAENRLIKVESLPSAPQASWRKVEWTYDAKGRRIRQTTYDGSSGNWIVTEDLTFISDPMSVGRHILELNASNNAVVRSYVWGLDLSGTLDGAGGVGGVLWVTMNSGPAAGTHYCCYDGNGNVVGLISANTGTETARYEYGLPHMRDEPVRVSGPAARVNPFRFSTKRTDDTTDLVLYEYRAYSPTLGRWLSRDPVAERGSENLYKTSSNDAVNNLDYLGLLGLRFRIIVGSFVGFADKYTNPAGYGEGEEDTDGKTYARSRIRVYSGNPKGSGTCNTIVPLSSPEKCNAGAIEVGFEGGCGKYVVYFEVDISISAGGPIGQARGILRGLGGYFFNDVVHSPGPPKNFKRWISVSFTISEHAERVRILTWDPIIAMPPRSPERDSFGEGKAAIWYRAIKKDGTVVALNPS